MTNLTKPVTRKTAKTVGRKRIIVTLAPCGGQEEALIGLRLEGQRNGYVLALSDAYRMAALWHGQKEKSAKAKARKDGIPWKRARLEFLNANRIG